MKKSNTDRTITGQLITEELSSLEGAPIRTQDFHDGVLTGKHDEENDMYEVLVAGRRGPFWLGPWQFQMVGDKQLNTTVSMKDLDKEEKKERTYIPSHLPYGEYRFSREKVAQYTRFSCKDCGYLWTQEEGTTDSVCPKCGSAEVIPVGEVSEIRGPFVEGRKSQSHQLIKFSNGTQLKCEVASTPFEQEIGLQKHSQLGEDEGMIFTYPELSRVSMWMPPSMSFPLDLIFTQQGEITKIYEDVQPGSGESYVGEADMVIEAGGGFCNRAGVGEGDLVEIMVEGRKADEGSLANIKKEIMRMIQSGEAKEEYETMKRDYGGLTKDLFNHILENLMEKTEVLRDDLTSPELDELYNWAYGEFKVLTAKTSQRTEISPGVRVVNTYQIHPEFGQEGVVISREGDMARVRFDSGVEKDIDAVFLSAREGQPFPTRPMFGKKTAQRYATPAEEEEEPTYLEAICCKCGNSKRVAESENGDKADEKVCPSCHSKNVYVARRKKGFSKTAQAIDDDEAQSITDEQSNLIDHLVARLKEAVSGEEKDLLKEVTRDFLGCDLKDVIKGGTQYPSWMKALVGCALKDVMKKYENIDYLKEHRLGKTITESQRMVDRYEGLITPTYDEVRTGLKKSSNVISAGRFYLKSGLGDKMVLDIALNAWGGPSLSIYTSKDIKGFSRRFISHIDKWIRDNNFFKGAKLTIGGCGITFLDIEPIKWDNIIMPKAKMEEIRKNTLDVLDNKDIYAKGMGVKRSLILNGPPGTGKTLTFKALANDTDATVIWVTGKSIHGSDDVESLYSMARSLSPTIIFFEDLDLLGGHNRREGGRSGVLGELLNQMDGAEAGSGLITLASTNDITAVDEALASRPGRFDRRIDIGTPDAEGRRQMFDRFIVNSKIKLVGEPNWDAIIKSSEGLTGAHIREIVNSAFIESVARGEVEGEEIRVKPEYLSQAVDLVRESFKITQSKGFAKKASNKTDDVTVSLSKYVKARKWFYEGKWDRMNGFEKSAVCATLRSYIALWQSKLPGAKNEVLDSLAYYAGDTSMKDAKEIYNKCFELSFMGGWERFEGIV